MPPKKRKSKTDGRLKNYFKCNIRHQRRNRSKIRNNIEYFCQKIGLKVDQIILSGRSKKIRYNQKPARITILKTRLSKSEKAFQCLIAKDLTNMSDKKYLSLRTIFKKIIPIPLSSLVWVNELKFSLDKIFEINQNEKGFFFNPVQKLKFVIAKFLLKKNDFKDKLVRIKLSADVTKISKTRIQILNFAFELLDDKDGISNVNRIFVLGTFLI
jgi:hypothetical protein